MSHNSLLAFADGAIFIGHSAGYDGIAVGEAVFNTAITGYQEILTDPSYCQQIINFTHPHIGNTGATPIDDEADGILAAGLVARHIPRRYSNWRATQSLPEFLRDRRVPAIVGVDTRAITRKLRDGGAMAACIMPQVAVDDEERQKEAVAAARAFGDLQGAMLAQEASRRQSEAWQHGLWQPATNDYTVQDGGGVHLVVLDCGIKNAILRHLAARGGRLTVLPYDSKMAAVLAQKPDGVVFSNGPGDPAPCAAAIDLARELLSRRMPLLGICLGHQILAAALGAKTVKMKFGHHGANHPVRDEVRGRVLITSQNHGFAVDAASLPAEVRATHISLFDGSLQGLACDSPPVMTFQGHPEASPGPNDATFLFDDFLSLVRQHKEVKYA